MARDTSRPTLGALSSRFSRDQRTIQVASVVAGGSVGVGAGAGVGAGTSAGVGALCSMER